MEGLIDEAKKLRAEIVLREKAIMAKKKYLTANKWRYGQVLAAINVETKKQAKGDWKKALTAIGETYQRADENIKIAASSRLRRKRASARCVKRSN